MNRLLLRAYAAQRHISWQVFRRRMALRMQYDIALTVLCFLMLIAVALACLLG